MMHLQRRDSPNYDEKEVQKPEEIPIVNLHKQRVKKKITSTYKF
jgi:hypothetical protein